MKNIRLNYLVISLLIPFFAGGIGSLATTPSIPTWYATLNKPFFNPPNWIFGPVWTLLYIGMGIALYLVWTAKKKTKERRTGLYYFAVQLMLNTFWSIMFFGLHNPLLALITILLLWYCIFRTIIAFRKVNVTSSRLLLPYIAWVSFAAILNAAIVLLNP